MKAAYSYSIMLSGHIGSSIHSKNCQKFNSSEHFLKQNFSLDVETGTMKKEDHEIRET